MIARGETPSKMAIIINAGSGSVENADLATQIRERFSAHGIEPQLCLCAQGEEIRRHAEEALHQGCNVVVAGGGDGTISTIASVVAGSNASLGVLPLGTLNHFAKDLGLPLDLDAAIAVIADGHAILVDIAEVNGRTFINNSSLGLYPTIVRHREEHQRLGSSKWWAFFKGMLTALGRYPLLQVRLYSKETQIVRRTPFVFIGNNEYEIHGLNIGTRARIDSGQLSVYMTRGISRLGLLRLALRGLVGRLRDAYDFDAISTDELQVNLHRHSVRVALDGEVVVMTSPLRYRCRKQELRVIVKGPEKTHSNGTRIKADERGF